VTNAAKEWKALSDAERKVSTIFVLIEIHTHPCLASDEL
jgi:hypothetical protein